jgi:hypothetical protein
VSVAVLINGFRCHFILTAQNGTEFFDPIVEFKCQDFEPLNKILCLSCLERLEHRITSTRNLFIERVGVAVKFCELVFRSYSFV